jgi:hypothetical protein
MKKLLLSIFLIVALISCNKGLGDLKYSETIPGGCATDKGTSSKNSLVSQTDKASYTIVDGNLNLFVGFNATCCGQYSTEYDINGDTITVKILTTQIGQCNCICYYTYNFKFIGSGNNYKYEVKIDNILTFTGEIKP